MYKRNIKRIFFTIKYKITNLFSFKQLTADESPLLVSMTSYGTRIDTVYSAIESIGAGKVRPAQIILWLTSTDAARVPATLRRLERRGLSIRITENFGSYKKLYPLTQLSSQLERTKFIITADDDVFYPTNWLQTFEEKTVDHRGKVIFCQRARRINFCGHRPTSYSSWPVLGRDDCDALEDHEIFPTGVGGVCYPVNYLIYLETYGTEFQLCAPAQDDIWFWAVGKAHGFRFAYLHNFRLDAELAVLATQKHTLWSRNEKLHGGENIAPNDKAISAVVEKFRLLFSKPHESHVMS